jgi:penicillin-binding protein 1A
MLGGREAAPRGFAQAQVARVRSRPMASAATRPAPARRRPRRRRKHPVLRTLGWLVLAVVVFLAATAAGLLAAPVDFTPPAPPRPALILDRNGKIIGEIASPEERVDVSAAQIPDVMRNAVVAAEDKSFYSNSGVDPLSIVRAALADISGDPTQGGSTITQQYVKNTFVGPQRTYIRKLREAALAIRLDQRLSKQEILTRYLNEVYFGQNVYGVQAASEYYFGIPASALDLSQASLLAGIIPAPSLYNPVTSLAKARVRQQYVLNRMVDSGYITTDTASAAFAAVPSIVAKVATIAASSVAPQFVSEVIAQVKSMYADQPDVLDRGGLGVRTTLDVNWQQAATAALAKVLPKATDPEAAVVVMDSDDGSILGQADKVGADNAEFDPATLALRVSGSSIKPFTLATALETGKYTDDTSVYGPSAKTYPTSVCPTTDGKPYTITNDEGGGGEYTLKSALAKSVNTVYGPLAITLGTAKVAATAKAAGLIPTIGASDLVCSMGLGVNVTPLDEAVAYSTLSDGGVHHDARDLLSVNENVGATGAGGQTIFTQPVTGTSQAVPATIASQVQDAMRAVVSYGTATAAQQPGGLDVYGKTGTTNDYTDAWFSGCVPAYHVCVTTWMGYQNTFTKSGAPNSMSYVEGVHDVVGGSLPAAVFAQTMDHYRSLAHPVVAPSTSPATTAPTSAFTPRYTPPPATHTVVVPPSTEATRTKTVAPPTISTPAPSGSVSAPITVIPTPTPTPTPTATGST